MADYTDYTDYPDSGVGGYTGGGGGLGGLGGIGNSLNSFLMNPLTQMSLKMMANNSPRIGQPVNTLEGVGDTVLKAGALQQKMQQDAASKQAMISALIDAGIPASQAAVLANNPAAAKMIIANQERRRGQAGQSAWESDAINALKGGTSAPPDVPSGEDNAPPEAQPQAPGPQTSAEPQQPASESADNTDNAPTETPQPNKTAEALDIWRKAASELQPQTPQLNQQAAAPAQAETPSGRVLAQAQAAMAQKGQGQDQSEPFSDVAKYAERTQSDARPAVQYGTPEATAQQLPQVGTPQGGMQTMEQRAPANQTAQAQQQPLPPPKWLNLPEDQNTQPEGGQSVRPQNAPQQRGVLNNPDQPAMTPDQVRQEYEAQVNERVPQGTSQQSVQAPTPQAAQTVTERALAQREQARIQGINAQIQNIDRLLFSRHATPHGAEALRKKLDDLYKEKQAGNKWKYGDIEGEFGTHKGWINEAEQRTKEDTSRAGTAGQTGRDALYAKIDAARAQGLSPDQIAEQVLPRGAKEYVRAMLRGDAIPSSMGRVKDDLKAKYYQIAHDIDPNLSEPRIALRQAFTRNMASTAANGWANQKRSAQTIVKHLGAALDNFDVVEKGAEGSPLGAYGESPVANLARAKLNEQYLDKNYNTAMEGFKSDTDVIAAEVVRLLTGGLGTREDRKAWEDRFDISKRGVSGVRGALNEAFTIMHGRMQPLAEQKDEAWGTQTDPMDLLGPRGKALEERIRNQGAAPGTEGAPRITPDEEGIKAYNALPRGRLYTDPDGKLKRKQ